MDNPYWTPPPSAIPANALNIQANHTQTAMLHTMLQRLQISKSVEFCYFWVGSLAAASLEFAILRITLAGLKGVGGIEICDLPPPKGSQNLLISRTPRFYVFSLSLCKKCQIKAVCAVGCLNIRILQHLCYTIFP